MAAGDVHDGARVGEVDRIGNAAEPRRPGRHGTVEDTGLLGMLVQVVERWHAQGVLEGVLAGTDGMREGAEAAVEDPAVQPGDVSERSGPQRPAEPGHGPPLAVAAYDAERREVAEDPVQQVGVGVRQHGEFGTGRRPGVQVVADAELRGRAQGLGGPCAGQHLEHPPRRVLAGGLVRRGTER